MPLYVADIVTAVDAVTGTVTTLKYGDFVPPAATTIESGTAAKPGCELVKDTVAPDAGAAPVRASQAVVTVVPPVIVAGIDREETTIGLIVRNAVFVTPAACAEIITVVEATTAAVVMLNLAETAPAGTVNVIGTATVAGTELTRLTTVPPAGAGTSSVTVFAVLVAPPVRETGDSAIR
jgi:hypothetical protein